MNRYWIMICVILSNGTCAMEIDKPQDTTCYIAQLPQEMQNKIAECLRFYDKEDDQEFAERTKDIPQGNTKAVIDYNGWEMKINKSIFGGIYIQVRHKVLGIKKIWLPYCFSVIFSCSPMMENIVYVDDTYGGYNIFNFKRNCGASFLMGRDEVVKAVGVSEVGNWVALVEKDRKGMGMARIFNGDENIASFPIEVPIDQVKSVAFNKQGTNIIVHGTDSHEIIPIVSEEAYKAKNKKTLAEYFRQRGVCKELKNSL